MEPKSDDISLKYSLPWLILLQVGVIITTLFPISAFIIDNNVQLSNPWFISFSLTISLITGLLIMGTAEFCAVFNMNPRCHPELKVCWWIYNILLAIVTLLRFVPQIVMLCLDGFDVQIIYIPMIIFNTSSALSISICFGNLLIEDIFRFKIRLTIILVTLITTITLNLIDLVVAAFFIQKINKSISESTWFYVSCGLLTVIPLLFGYFVAKIFFKFVQICGKGVKKAPRVEQVITVSSVETGPPAALGNDTR
eukprot:NP_497681.1 Uncharacterized protein CELE_Y53G8AM.7 [Caenorhabditis elegans]